MISETVEFVVDFFDNTFEPVLNMESVDPRLTALRKYCTSLKNMRSKRGVDGSVICSLQILDNLKYLEPSFNTMMDRMANGEIKTHDEESGECIADIMIASFKTKDGKPIPISGWKTSMDEFIKIMRERNKQITDKKFKSGTNSFYLRSIPDDTLGNKKEIEFIIFGIIIKSDKDGYDRTQINILGLPKSRQAEMHEKIVKDMFGY